MSEKVDYQQRYAPLINSIDSKPAAKADFEQILNKWYSKYVIRSATGEPVLTGSSSANDLEQKLAPPRTIPQQKFSTGVEEMFKARVDKKLGPVEDVIKAYIAHGRLYAESVALLPTVWVVAKQQRFRGYPTLQKIANTLLKPLDFISLMWGLVNGELTDLEMYADKKFPELNKRQLAPPSDLPPAG